MRALITMGDAQADGASIALPFRIAAIGDDGRAATLSCTFAYDPSETDTARNQRFSAQVRAALTDNGMAPKAGDVVTVLAALTKVAI